MREQLAPLPDARYVGVLPRNWERAFGYDLERGARWLAAWWEPAGDEAMYDDGRLSGTGHWLWFLDLVERRLRREIQAALAGCERGRWALGSSDERPDHCLLLDLQERAVYVAPLRAVGAFLRKQHAGYFARLAQTPPEELRAAIEAAVEEAAGWQEVATSFAICAAGCQQGWFVRDDGYDRCATCGGKWLIPA